MYYLSGKGVNLDPSLFAVVCWLLWKNRNTFVFEEKLAADGQIQVAARRIQQLIAEALKRDPSIRGEQLSGEWRSVGWEFPPAGWSCINTDGSVALASQSATAGGVVRDDHGRFLGAFVMNLGGGTITRAELMGIRQGLQVAWDLGVRKAVLRSDSKSAVELIASATTSSPHFQLVSQVRRLINQEWEVRVEHTYREGNVVADYLASTGYNLLVGVHIVSVPSPMMQHWLLFDLVGSVTPRLIYQ
ncbi:unnamed protein product [Linum tenue]|uniref:RNase H type-1 domain-containing protein n=2 Tax=Linum tenue TaxID=586396 RepID=A0AAV0K8Z2_9ROSI|nr:unnamed protein product [Linum tenue]